MAIIEPVEGSNTWSSTKTQINERVIDKRGDTMQGDLDFTEGAVLNAKDLTFENVVDKDGDVAVAYDANTKTVKGYGLALSSVYVGTYTGDGEESQKISLDFEPVCVIIWRSNGQQGDCGEGCEDSCIQIYGGMALQNSPCSFFGTDAITLSGKDFYVYYKDCIVGGYSRSTIRTNIKNESYFFLAIK